ncbi:carbohydrate ABC transporter permease [Glycomyces arizonensis]|uniref:carbohydrate ABC transporter permease n=1 Tax=Glycomyces arizonensis TaxID=256035 RepID=UPI000410BFF8|nr:carbohydrate ABC transporter permease [Glycomyces arizonensis]
MTALSEARRTAPTARPKRRRPSRAAEEMPVGHGQSRRSQLFVLAGLGLFFVYSVAPIWWLVVSATKDQRDLYASPGVEGLWFGDLNLLENLKLVLTYDDGVFARWTVNTIFYSGTGALVSTLIALAAGYGIAKFRFRGRRIALGFIVATFLVPGMLLAFPLYLLFTKMGLVDTVWAVLIPSFVNAFSVYLAKVYCDSSVPDELLDAARVDGAGEVRLFFQIVVRIMTSGAATIFLLAFVGAWNSFFLPLMMLRGSDKWTLALGLYSWAGKRVESGTDLTSLVIMGSLLSTIPLAVFMIAMARFWRSGVTLGSLK